MNKRVLPPYAPERISIITHQLGLGGLERVAAILANGFAVRGIDTELLICANGGAGEDVLKNIICEKVAVRLFRKSSGSRVMDLLKSFSVMGRHLRQSKPDVVLSSGNHASMFSLFLTLFYCPSTTRLYIKTTNPVLRPHEVSLKRFFRPLWYWLIFRLSDGVLTLSDHETLHLMKAFPYLQNKIYTVNNPYITVNNKPKVSSKVVRRTNKPKCLIAVGRMQHQKRFDVLLKAFARVRKKVDCRLVILGDGEDRQSLIAMCKTLEIEQSIDMPGFVTNVHDWLEKADLLVLSSDYEGLPAVVLESLAHNCPVVTTECFFGASELLNNAAKCGVSPIREPESLADTIINSLKQECSTSELYRLAERYRIETAIESHIEAFSHLTYQEHNLARFNT